MTLLLLQPDLGMTLVILTTWLGQLFIAGISLVWMGVLGSWELLALGGAYFFSAPCHKRINQFLDPSSGDPRHDLYQIHKSLEAFRNGGCLEKDQGRYCQKTCA